MYYKFNVSHTSPEGTQAYSQNVDQAKKALYSQCNQLS